MNWTRVYSMSQKCVSRSTWSTGYHSVPGYEETLMKLFQAVKQPSRHSATLQDSLAIFHDRKQYFNEVYSKAAEGKIPAKVIHVAGTKGKGSTVEYIASCLNNEGHRVGVFTSPHLHSARERIKIGHSLISKEDVVRLGNNALTDMSSKPWIVFFDLLLHVAINYFYEQNVDYIVLETGVGGRYDSTNFLDKIDAAVLTSISIDHQALLGDTVEKIAWQKAGIIKENCHVFTSTSQKPSVLEVFRNEALLKHATLHENTPDRKNIESLSVSVPYDFQVQNACLAQSVVHHLGLSSNGMKEFYWPCRAEKFNIQSKKLKQVILDGSHNEDSVNLFLSSVKQEYPKSKLVLVFGGGVEKSLNDMLIQTLQLADSVVLVQSKHFKSATENQLREMCSSFPYHDKIECIEDLNLPQGESTIDKRLQWAIEKYASESCETDSVLVVCGSLFVAAEAREFLAARYPQLFSSNDWIYERD